MNARDAENIPWLTACRAPSLVRLQFNIAGGSNEGTPATACPRSSTRHSAAKADGTYDVAIIGAGCIGAAVAREECARSEDE